MPTCTYTSTNGKMTFQFEFADAKDLFALRAMVELHDEEKCGKCGCADIRCDIQKSGDFTYYHMRCQNQACKARLDFGQKKDMVNLFVKRDEHPATNGWYVFQGNDREQDEAPRQPNGHTAGTNGSAGPKTPIPSKNGSTKPAEPPPTKPTDEHAKVLAALRVADTKENADAWLAHGASKLRTAAQRTEQEKAYREALARIGRVQF
ncbi:MAG TPA: hypothetical protein VFE62_06400 [Gemmataceae bacterium]|nr:hypothetical protein [Gemmataceae bacterium]